MPSLTPDLLVKIAIAAAFWAYVLWGAGWLN